LDVLKIAEETRKTREKLILTRRQREGEEDPSMACWRIGGGQPDAALVRPQGSGMRGGVELQQVHEIHNFTPIVPVALLYLSTHIMHAHA
jgi:hypothetical protein